MNRRVFAASLAAAVAFWRRTRAAGEIARVEPLASRPIPRSGERIPVIGMGTWLTFDPPAPSAADLVRLADVLKALFDAGGRVIDTSPMYGRAEAHTGQLLEQLGLTDGAFIATKVWTTGASEGQRQLDNSSQLLRRSRLDLEQVHNLVDWRAQLDLLRRAKAQGRVRYIGVTHYQESSFDELERIVRREQPDFVQLPYSVAFRAVESRLLPAARDSGTAVIINEPFAGGSVFANLRATPVPEWARPYGTSWAQLFLKFILAHPAVTCVIPATSNPSHMRENASAGTGLALPPEHRARLVEAAGA